VLLATWSARAQLPDALDDPFVLDVAPSYISVTRIATDGSGSWIAVWDRWDAVGGEPDIVYSRSVDGGLTWSAPAPVDANAGSDTSYDQAPLLAMDGTGTAVVVWNRDADVAFARSTDGGLTWSAPTLLAGSANTFGHDIATDGAGTWVVTWTAEPADYEIQVVRSTDGGASWSAPTGVSGAILVTPVAHVAASATGTFLVAWDGVSIARSTDAGATWAPPVFIGLGAQGPRVATDGSGTWLVVARTFDFPFSSSVYRSLDDGASWNPAIPLSGWFVDVVVDGSGVLLVGGSPVPGPAILLRRSNDSGLTWAGPVIAKVPVSQFATDGAGGWIAMGSTLSGDNDSTIVVTGGRTVCPLAPLDGCRLAPAGGKLKMKQSSLKSRDKLAWNWKRGEAVSSEDLGDPTSTDSYAFCVYDATGNPVAAASIPAGGTCGTTPCWTEVIMGFNYRNLATVPDGVKMLKVRHGDVGTPTIAVKAAGERLMLPLLDPADLQLPITAQASATTGTCWEDTYSSALVNKPGGFKARAD
jgi:hypothetical protein